MQVLQKKYYLEVFYLKQQKKSVKKAIIISTLTFGIGHIVNLFNGQDTLNTIIQIIYALSLGYLFVMIFYKSNSLVPRIITQV